MDKEESIWSVYIVRCRDDTLYTGITNDLAKRIEAHNSGRDGARYTRSRRPVTLVYEKKAGSKSAASKMEYSIKKLSRTEKIRIVEGKADLKMQN